MDYSEMTQEPGSGAAMGRLEAIQVWKGSLQRPNYSFEKGLTGIIIETDSTEAEEYLKLGLL